MTKCERPEDLVCISCVDEVRYSFVSHLSAALRRRRLDNVVVDVDNDDLFSNESQAKFEKARVSVMVLPGNCEPTKVYLDKFEKILECQRNKDHVVVPVLYGDSPLQGGEWLNVLDLRGLSQTHQSRRERSDSKLVEEIVKDVLHVYEKLFYKGRPGLHSKILDIENMVNKQPIGIRYVGIWGMPGIGKTTLAKAVFDQMSGNFDAHCFIEDYDKAIHEKGLYRLLGEQFLKENSATGGILTSLSFLKNILSTKGVLVVLDDVRNALIAESFLEEFDWFAPKSLIIITSRDKQVFGLCRINQIYEVQGLNENEARQVVKLCTSIKDIGEQNLRELSTDVIKYANGNPLALSIYGRRLQGQLGGPSEMVTGFSKLKRCAQLEIVDAIKGSYETLSNTEKNIFLDIACFFSGENVDYVMQLLEACSFFPHVGIDVLVEKCLVTISENKVQMHNMIQDFGRELVNGETAEIERGSRLWEPYSIRGLLEDNGQKYNGEHKTTFRCVQGTEEIEGMFLDTSNLSFDVKPAAFENMLNLRLLKIYCSNPKIHTVISFPKGSLHSLPNELRLLHWENYPLKSLPQNFDPRHLVEINMQYSQLQTLWSGTKNLEMLRTIRLCHSQKLVNMDDLQNAQNIEVIDLQGCTKLQSFPPTGEMLHLRVLNLSGCTEIKSLSEIPPNIEMLHLQGTGIKELPLSIVKPIYSEILNHLAKIPGVSSVSNLESDLKYFINMKMSTSCLDLGKLICLELKDCSRLKSLPDMVNLDLLRVIDLSGCSKLQTIQGFPRNLKGLNIAGTAVRQLPQLPQSLELFNAHGCFDLSPEVLKDILVKALANVKHMPREREQELNEALAFSFCAPSHSNLNSTLHLQLGYSVMIRLDTTLRDSLVGFAMLLEVAFSEDYCDDTDFDVICVCRWRNKEGNSHMIERNLHCWAPGKAVPNVQNNHIFVFVDLNMRPGTDEGNDHNIWGDLVVFEFFPINKQKKPLDDSCRLTRCGVRVINAVSGNTSLENILPVLSLRPKEVSGNKVEEELFWVNYCGLQEKDKVIFLYIASLFNYEGFDYVAPLITSNIDLDVSSGLKVLADRSLISLSSNGEIVMHSLLRHMGKEILHGQSMVLGSSKTLEILVDNSQSSMLTQSKNPGNWTTNLSDVPERRKNTGINVDQITKSWNASKRAYQTEHYYNEEEGGVIFFAFRPSFSAKDLFASENKSSFGEIKMNRVQFPCMRSIGNNVDATVNEAFLKNLKVITNPRTSFYASVESAFERRKQIVFTGHSSGGATAILATVWYLETFIIRNPKAFPSPEPSCVTFGAPLVGDYIFSHALGRENWSRFFVNIVARFDIVPRLMLARKASTEQTLPLVLGLLDSTRPATQENDQRITEFYTTVMQGTSTVAYQAVCGLNGNEEAFLQSIPSFVELSPYRPVGTFVFSTEQRLVAVKNSDAILQMLFCTSQSSDGQEWSLIPFRSIREHHSYEELVQSMRSKQLNHLDGENFIESDLSDLGVSTRARQCLHAAFQAEKRREENQKKIETKRSKIDEKLKWIDNAYKPKCQAHKYGYYDSFKVSNEKKDFKANAQRAELAGIFDEVLGLVKKGQLPDGFEGRKEWIDLATRYRRLIEPLDIANYYRHLKNKETGPYMIKGRPNRYIHAQRGYEHSVLKEVGVTAKDIFWSKVNTLNLGSQLEMEEILEISGSKCGSCFWAEVEELKGKPYEEVKARIKTLEGLLEGWINENEVDDKEIFLEGSTFRKWWITLPEGHKFVSPLHSFQRQMGKEILHGQYMAPDSSKTSETLVDNSQSSMLTQSMNPGYKTRNLSDFLERYHVYLSFYGPDVRKRFLSHLYNHFANKGIRTFIDQEIWISHTIGPEIVQRIRESQISVVVLSEKYASSGWCLDELVEIFKCKEAFGQSVMPIFYDVDPSDVRKQRGDFGKAFRKTCKGKTEEVKQRWSKALAHVASIAGEHSFNWVNEAEMIQKITTDVSNILIVTLSSDI